MWKIDNQVFKILRESYEEDNKILTAGELQDKMKVRCSGSYLLEGIYAFNQCLDKRREGVS